MGASNAEQVIEPVVYALIEPAFMAKISWTGRARPNETKIALQQFVNITNLITYTMNKASNSTQADTLKMLKYKVIKYASTKVKNASNIESSDDSKANATSKVTTSNNSPAHR